MLCRQIIIEVNELMVLENYSSRTIDHYNKIWRSLMRFNAENNNTEEFNLDNAFDFLKYSAKRFCVSKSHLERDFGYGKICFT